MPTRQVDFVLMLHSHLPYLLRHGRWPHGSDWLCEAAVGTYLPLLATLQQLGDGNVAAPVTLGVTPVLASQLEEPAFGDELERYFAHRLEGCRSAAGELRGSGPDDGLGEVVRSWEARYRRLQQLWRSLDGGLLGAWRRLQDDERLELASSAATHPYLPLLGRDESIRLQLAVGRREHRRLFGRDADGCWLPECGYRPRGLWSPDPAAPGRGVRRGIEEFLSDAGYRWCFVDAHQAHAGEPLGAYGEPHDLPRPLRVDSGNARRRSAEGSSGRERSPRSPYRAYRISRARASVDVAAFVRDPLTSRRVWSRGDGYPGDGAYLEFHRQRWPDGLRLWRVTGPEVPLGEKAPYEPATARLTARGHAHDFAETLERIARDARHGASVIAVPFDTELFGHWWFEGPSFLADLYAEMPHRPVLRAVTASEHLDSHATPVGIRLARGSWGREGDDRMWYNDAVQWMWVEQWALEDAFWTVAPRAVGEERVHPLLDAATRALLLLQASDWPFMVTTGEVADYGASRFRGHAADLRLLLAAMEEALAGGDPSGGLLMVDALARRDALFPDLVPVVAETLAASDDPAVVVR